MCFLFVILVDFMQKFRGFRHVLSFMDNAGNLGVNHLIRVLDQLLYLTNEHNMQLNIVLPDNIKWTLFFIQWRSVCRMNTWMPIVKI